MLFQIKLQFYFCLFLRTKSWARDHLATDTFPTIVPLVICFMWIISPWLIPKCLALENYFFKSHIHWFIVKYIDQYYDFVISTSNFPVNRKEITKLCFYQRNAWCYRLVNYALWKRRLSQFINLSRQNSMILKLRRTNSRIGIKTKEKKLFRLLLCWYENFNNTKCTIVIITPTNNLFLPLYLWMACK